MIHSLISNCGAYYPDKALANLLPVTTVRIYNPGPGMTDVDQLAHFNALMWRVNLLWEYEFRTVSTIAIIAPIGKSSFARLRDHLLDQL